MIDPTIRDRIISNTIVVEAGYSNRAADRGGPTKYGVTLATLRGIPGYEHATAETVKNLTIPEATQIYRTVYTLPFEIIDDPTTFKFVFNGAVQHGVVGMTKLLQKAMGLSPDGVIGSKTKAALMERSKQPLEFFARLVATRMRFYASILINDHSQRANAAGWFNRVADDLNPDQRKV